MRFEGRPGDGGGVFEEDDMRGDWVGHGGGVVVDGFDGREGERKGWREVSG